MVPSCTDTLFTSANTCQDVKENLDKPVKETKVKEELNVVEIKSEPKELKDDKSLVKSEAKTHSRESNSKDRRKEHSERRHCTRCYERRKIKRASIGVQCRRDRVPSQPKTPQKSTIDNMRLNLQMKNVKTLDKMTTKCQTLQSLKYKDFIHIETYPNGGATVVHMYQDEIDSLNSEQMEELVQEYFKVR